MALADNSFEIVWSSQALSSYEAILDYFQERFSTIDTQKFVRKTVRILEYLSKDPTMFRRSAKGRNKHIVVITKQTTLYYRFKPRKKEVELLLFWDVRRNPKRLKY